MVLQKAVDNLKERPKEDKKVVAGSIAIMVIAVLFFGWAILFLKKIQSGDQQLEFSSGPQDEFLSESVRAAQQDLENMLSNTNELERIRDESTSRQYDETGGGQPSYTGDSSDPFSPSN
jgi:hypothetical protein